MKQFAVAITYTITYSKQMVNTHSIGVHLCFVDAENGDDLLCRLNEELPEVPGKIINWTYAEVPPQMIRRVSAEALLVNKSEFA